MDFIKDLKDLKSLLQLCRKQGVTEITLGTIAFKLGDLPTKESQQATDDHNEIPSDDPYASFPDGVLTPEQLMYYSSGGDPAQDPYKDAQ